MKKLLSYIQALQPLLNVSELERLVGCPDKTIHKALQGAQDLPIKWASDIIKVLCQKFKVVQLGDDFIEWSDTAFIFRVWSIAEEFDPIEHHNYIEYPATLSKSIEDEFDILEYLK